MIPEAARKYVYYEEDDIILLQGDCLEILPLFEADSVDLVLTDPPYGIGKKWQGGSGENHGWSKSHVEKEIRNNWDESPPSPELINKLQKYGTYQIIWGGNYFNLPPSRCWLIWNKPERGFSLAEAELAWTNADNVVRVFDIPRHESNRKHPTQKPVKLFKQCLSLSWTTSLQTILDPFLGSGTTAVAAKQLGRKCIGIELESKYLDIAVRRLAQGVLV